MAFDNFETWMRCEAGLSSSSAKKYLRAIKGIDSDLSVDGRNLNLINDINEIENAKQFYFQNDENRKRNERGHNMYSSAFSQYISYRSSLRLGHQLAKDERFERCKKQLRDIDGTDGSNPILLRREQGILRDYLFGGVGKKKCSICHRMIPIDLMVAAHIKPRSQCTEAERKNPNIVMPVCKIGCDDFFEKGYILVASGGDVKENSQKEIPEDLREILSGIVGKICTHYSDDTAQFFEFRRSNLL